jgi:hypothetical protein
LVETVTAAFATELTAAPLVAAAETEGFPGLLCAFPGFDCIPGSALPDSDPLPAAGFVSVVGRMIFVPPSGGNK